MLTFFTTSASPTTCKTSPGQEDWIGDRICDDDYNNQQCNWDGGDCCLDENPGSDCLDPNSPNYSGSTTPSQQTTTTKQETTMTTTKATLACDISPGEEDWIGDYVAACARAWYRAIQRSLASACVSAVCLRAL